MTTARRGGSAGASPEAAMLRLGGASAWAVAAGYAVIVVLYAASGARPPQDESWIVDAAGASAAWWAILALSVATDLLLVPVAVALYLALRRAARPAAFAALALLLSFVVLDLAVTWPAYATLIALGERFAAAGSGAERSALLTAAVDPATLLASRLWAAYAILVPSLGILAAGAVMARAGLGRLAGALGWLTGVSGAVAVLGPLVLSQLGTVAILTSVLTTAWLLVLGRRLRARAGVRPAS